MKKLYKGLIIVGAFLVVALVVTAIELRLTIDDTLANKYQSQTGNALDNQKASEILTNVMSNEIAKKNDIILDEARTRLQESCDNVKNKDLQTIKDAQVYLETLLK